MNLYVGTSGYSYKAWKGRFYPPDLPDKRMLHYYAQHFRSVEINSTFYRMPTTAAVQAWADEVPEDFSFVLKAPQRITHMQRLKDAGDSLADLLAVAGVLKERLGPLLFQLPPNLRKDLARLREFIALLPRECRAAFEFRHPSWFEDDVFSLLENHRTALCIAEGESDPATPSVATTDWGYLRLRRLDYGDAELKSWVQWLRGQAWRDAFVFFKHEDEARGPRFAARFLELAAQNGGA